MTNREKATKICLGKRLVQSMANDHFWIALINGRIDRFFNAIEKALEKLPFNEEMEMTDESLSDLLFLWTLPVRSAVIQEFQDSLNENA